MFFGWSRRIVGFSKLGNVDQFVLRKWLLGLTAKPFDDLAETIKTRFVPGLRNNRNVLYARFGVFEKALRNSAD